MTFDEWDTWRERFTSTAKCIIDYAAEKFGAETVRDRDMRVLVAALAPQRSHKSTTCAKDVAYCAQWADAMATQRKKRRGAK